MKYDDPRPVTERQQAHIEQLKSEMIENRKDLERAEIQLREICLMCGFDPSDGEGTTPEEVTKAVKLHLVDERDALAARVQPLEDALRAIAELEPRPIEDPFPPDWQEQVKNCPECQRYKDHPIQLGICNAHRQPIWERERRDKSARSYLPLDMRDIARAALGTERAAT